MKKPFMMRIPFVPSALFYARVIAIVMKASAKAKRGRYGAAELRMSSLAVLRSLESVGCRYEVSGLERLSSHTGPFVYVANHMSTLETFVLSGIIPEPEEAVFVVKRSLLHYPVFGHVMRALDPISVNRTNPREDLRAVMEGGLERLRTGRSIIVFPQATRSHEFDPAAFNTLGIKLAKKADVPVVPIALKTDAWGNGRLLKDFGRIDPSKRIYFSFGAPIRIQGRGDEEIRTVRAFISGKLREWNERRDG